MFPPFSTSFKIFSYERMLKRIVSVNDPTERRFLSSEINLRVRLIEPHTQGLSFER